jgi:hypothetical protein
MTHKEVVNSQEKPMPTPDFPDVGHMYEANFAGDVVFHLDNKAATQMTCMTVEGANKGLIETENISRHVHPARYRHGALKGEDQDDGGSRPGS